MTAKPGTTHRECPHCKEQMRRDASVCPHCRRSSEPWTFHNGAWWVKRMGEWLIYDEELGDFRSRSLEAANAAPKRRSPRDIKQLGNDKKTWIYIAAFIALVLIVSSSSNDESTRDSDSGGTVHSFVPIDEANLSVEWNGDGSCQLTALDASGSHVGFDFFDAEGGTYRSVLRIEDLGAYRVRRVIVEC